MAQNTSAQNTGQQSNESTSGATAGVASGSRVGTQPARLADETAQGKTIISTSVVQKIAGIATREIPGVYAMGGGVSRAMGALRERIPGSSTSGNTSGVQVEVGEKQAAVDLNVVVEYGVSIVELARAVRRNVINATEAMTGLEVTEVNISVDDIHFPDDDARPATSRVE